MAEGDSWWRNSGNAEVGLMASLRGRWMIEARKDSVYFLFFYFIVLRSICVYEGSRPGNVNSLEIKSWVNLKRFTHSQCSRFQLSGGSVQGSHKTQVNIFILILPLNDGLLQPPPLTF